MLAAAAVMMTGCTVGTYMTATTANSNFTNATCVELTHANFRVVKNVHTFVTYPNTMKLTPEKLNETAYSALLREANLTGAQALINVTIEEVGRSTFLLGQAAKFESGVMVTGTVIEFTGK